MLCKQFWNQKLVIQLKWMKIFFLFSSISEKNILCFTINYFVVEAVLGHKLTLLSCRIRRKRNLEQETALLRMHDYYYGCLSGINKCEWFLQRKTCRCVFRSHAFVTIYLQMPQVNEWEWMLLSALSLCLKTTKLFVHLFASLLLNEYCNSCFNC